jgi:hypothetical protein
MVNPYRLLNRGQFDKNVPTLFTNSFWDFHSTPLVRSGDHDKDTLTALIKSILGKSGILLPLNRLFTVIMVKTLKSVIIFLQIITARSLM